MLSDFALVLSVMAARKNIFYSMTIVEQYCSTFSVLQFLFCDKHKQTELEV